MTPRSGSAPVLATAAHRNEVVVAGRLTAPAATKLLPSGEEIVNWRLAVERGSADGSGKVDLLDCTATLSRVRSQAMRWTEGQVVEVTGALRRRFWRGAAGIQSRCEVEVVAASRCSAGAKRARG